LSKYHVALKLQIAEHVACSIVYFKLWHLRGASCGIVVVHPVGGERWDVDDRIESPDHRKRWQSSACNVSLLTRGVHRLGWIGFKKKKWKHI